MQPTLNNIDQQNDRVKSWFQTTYREIKTRYMGMINSPTRSGDGLDRLKLFTKQSYGEIDRGGFSFDRHLVFVHKGAGKGHGGRVGSKWYYKGQLKSTKATSLGKMNSGARRAEEWLNPVLDSELPKLADIVANFKADAALKAIQIR